MYATVLVVLLLQLLLLLHQLLLLIQLHCNMLRVKYDCTTVFGYYEVVLLTLLAPLDCLTGSKGGCTELQHMMLPGLYLW